MALGATSGTELRFSRTRGRVSGASDYGVSYPSPFFDIAHTYLPATVKNMFRWCRYYFLVNPLINATVFKMAEYPVTDIIFDTEREELKERWSGFLMDQLRYRAFQLEVGLDYNCYGNALVSIFYPFIKMLRCSECGYEQPAKDATYRFQNFKFYQICPKCGHHGPAKVRDHYIKAHRGIRLIRWNPEDIDIHYNEITGEYSYYYQIPNMLRNDIIIGKKSVVETVPQLFIESLRLKKAVVFSRDNIYHFKRPTLAGKDRGWGTPMILPVLKDTFYLQILRKAQECVSPTSEIETPSGLVLADDVRVGDLVRTHTGVWKPVEKKWYRDAREGEIGRKITLTSMRGYPTVYSPQHPVFTIRRNEQSRRKDTKEVQRSSVILKNPHLYEEVLCPAEQLGVGEYVLYPRHLPVQETYVDVALRTGLASTDGFVYSGCGEETAASFESLEKGEAVAHDNAGRVAKRAFKEGRTPKRMPRVIPMTDDLAYILGWYAGDGSCNARSVFFSLGKEDDAAPLVEAIQREFGVTATIEEGKSVNTVVLSDVIVRHLIKNLIPGTAQQKKAPGEVLVAPESMKLAYLRGLWEADGCGDDGRITITSSSRDQAYDVYRIAIHLGCIATIGELKPSVSVIDGREVRGKGSYNVSVCGASADRLRSLWECGNGQEVVSGKSGFFRGDYFATRICAVEEVEEAQYIDFKVADDTTFCTPGTATKNSIALEHIVPLRVLFPQAGSATSDPYCVSHDTLVETWDGLRPAGEVKAGDYLKSHTGKWRLVEESVDRQIESGEDVYEFTVSGLTAFPFKISEEHPLFGVHRPTRFRGYDSLGVPDWIDAKDVREGDFVCYPTRRVTWDSLAIDIHDYCPERAATDNYVYRRLTQHAAEIYEYFESNSGVPSFGHGEKKRFLEEHGWSEEDYATASASYTQQDRIDRRERYITVTKELAYLIGAYAAEGSPKDQLASLALHANETDFMDKLDECVGSLGFRPSTRSFRDNSATYEINDVFLAALLVRSCGKGTQSKRLPRKIVEAPLDIAMEAVRATLRGDGCSFDTSTRRVGLKTVSPQLAMDVRAILLSDGLIPTVQKAVPREDEISKLPYYQVNLNGVQADAFEDLPAGKKYRQAFSRCGFIRDGYVYLRVAKKVTTSSVKIVRGFQMAGDRSFCVAGVATHNTTVNLQDWRDQVAGEIRRWRSDNNYIPIMPLPLGHQTIGGDGRALLLSQEIRVWSEHIVAGMGIPVELIFGGLSYSGSNVSLRMLENTFLGYLQDHSALLKWVVSRTSAYLGWAPVATRFKPFKMADDLQRKAYLFQLNQAGKISDESLVADADHDSAKEDQIMEREAARRSEAMKKSRLQQAEMEGEAQLAQMKWQLKAQQQQMKQEAALQNEMMKDQMAFQGQQQTQMMQDQMAIQQGQQPAQPPRELQSMPRNPSALQTPQGIQSPLSMRSVQKIPAGATGEQLAGRQNVDILLMGRQIADRINRMNPPERPAVLAKLRAHSPELHDVVLGLMMSGSGGPSRAGVAASRPLPEQKPARRGPESQQL